MDAERFGRAIRALRHRRGWTQADLGLRAGCSRAVISRLERGHLSVCSLGRLERVLGDLDARLRLSMQWRGGELERPLDADHSRLAEIWAQVKPPRWESRTEVTYNLYGDRGSIDELAFDRSTATLLVSELKTGIYEAGRTAAKLDEKVRLAPRVAGRIGWRPYRVVAALVVAEGRTNRRRIEAHGALFGRLACRGRGARAWLKDPAREVGDGLLLFLPLPAARGTNVRRAGRQRVRPSSRLVSVKSARSSAADDGGGA